MGGGGRGCVWGEGVINATYIFVLTLELYFVQVFEGKMKIFCYWLTTKEGVALLTGLKNEGYDVEYYRV